MVAQREHDDDVIYEVTGYTGYYAGASGGVYKLNRDRAPRRVCALSQTPDREGYPRVRFTRDGRRSWIKVTKVMSLAFMQAKPSSVHQVRHLDGNNRNNAAWNLKWGTPKENCADRERHGTTARGSRHGVTTLDESRVREMRALMDSGESTVNAALWFGVSQATASRIKRRVYWRHV